jgi:LysR family transcriptional regulator, carnitine catabolism transcriptional activator
VKHLNITLRHLRTFIIVARQGSFNLAAQELSRTQPAVTLAIKQLEEFVGIKLLERTTRSVAPTNEGENFLPIAERLVRDFDSAIYDLRATAERRVGHVSIAIVPSVATNLLPPIIKTFSNAYPGINLHLDDDSSRGVQQRVERNEVDFGVGSMWQPSQNLDFTPLFSDQLQLVCHRDHPLSAESGPIEWGAMENETFLDSGITKTLRTRQHFASSKFDFPNITTLMAMLKSNLGVSILPSLAVPSSDQELVTRLLVPIETREIGLITRRAWTLSPAAETMAETILNEVPKQLANLGLSALVSSDNSARLNQPELPTLASA